jgi:acetoacetyl-CoA reductase/3-oxoacyl-[acyl-carrier protein] reductase
MSAAPDPAALLSLARRGVLVCGAAGGIGAAVTGLLARAGARVAALDLPGRPAPAGAELGLEADVGRAEDCAEAVRRTEAHLGRLDGLVHCAGITRDAVLWKMDDAAWRDVLRVNLDSAFYLLRAAAPRLRAAGDAAVVLVSSINGERGKFGQANYAASKAGLVGLARTAAREFGRFGVRVNVVAPGLIDTPLTAGLSEEHRRQALAETPLGRIGRSEDVACAVLFLISPLSRHVTGQVLRVDGGQLIA